MPDLDRPAVRSGSDLAKAGLPKERVVIIGHLRVLKRAFRPGNTRFTATISDLKACGMVRRKWFTKSMVIPLRELNRTQARFRNILAMTSSACKKESFHYHHRRKSKWQATSRP